MGASPFDDYLKETGFCLTEEVLERVRFYKEKSKVEAMKRFGEAKTCKLAGRRFSWGRLWLNGALRDGEWFSNVLL